MWRPRRTFNIQHNAALNQRERMTDHRRHLPLLDETTAPPHRRASGADAVEFVVVDQRDATA
jgi:hypothetical protein